MAVAALTSTMRLLSRHLGLVKFFGVGLVVFFAGSALTTHFTSKLLLDVSGVAQAASETDEDPFEGEDEEAEEAADAKAKAAQKVNDRALASMANKSTRKQLSADSIVAANMFCPSCIPVEDQPLLASAGAEMQIGEVESKLPLRLLATMESDDPTWSMATIQDVETNRLGPYTANEQVRPGVTILAVERGRVVLLNQGRREFINLGAEPPKPGATPQASKPAAATKGKPSGKSVAIEGADQAIDCANENSCTVDRAFVEKLMADPRQLMSQARMFPVTKDGETQGFRVSGIKSGSLATMLGLKNGDVVSEINGAKLGTIDDALAMYQKLRRANHLSVTVERGGAVINKEISIK
jgi:type II secretion system protein C